MRTPVQPPAVRRAVVSIGSIAVTDVYGVRCFGCCIRYARRRSIKRMYAKQQECGKAKDQQSFHKHSFRVR